MCIKQRVSVLLTYVQFHFAYTTYDTRMRLETWEHDIPVLGWKGLETHLPNKHP